MAEKTNDRLSSEKHFKQFWFLALRYMAGFTVFSAGNNNDNNNNNNNNNNDNDCTERHNSRFFVYNLLTAPWTVSNMHAQVDRAQLCVTTRGVTVSMSAFLACHQCYCAGSSLAWGLNLRAVVCGIFWSLSPGVFSGYSGFLPSFIGLMVQPIK